MANVWTKCRLTGKWEGKDRNSKQQLGKKRKQLRAQQTDEH